MYTPLDFIQRVVAWPGLDGPGYVNLHWKPTVPKHERDFRGKPYKDAQTFLDDAWYFRANPNTYREIYFCTSTQKLTGKLVHGRPIAVRARQHILALKAIWIDVDVKPDGYTTLREALREILLFEKAMGLPPHSALILTGGGVHVYWISDKPLTEAEWRPYAEGLRELIKEYGLKCDAGLTTDAIRVLRVPGTNNNKLPLARPVTVADMGPDYDFAVVLAGVAARAPARSAAAAITGAVTNIPQFVLPQGFKTSALFDTLNQQAQQDPLGSGISLHPDRPLDGTKMFKQCHHFRDCLVNGGVGHGQGLWNQTLLACTWLEHGPELAHGFSKGYNTGTKKYDPNETQAKFDEKRMARAANPNIGWPSCTAFEAEGANCKGCPFYKKIKSPLNLAERVAPPPGTVDRPSLPPPIDMPDFPDDYAVNPIDGIICRRVVIKTKGGEPEDALVPLFMSRLRNFVAQDGGRVGIRFETSLDDNQWGDVFLPEVDLTTEQQTVRTLREQRVKPNPKHQKEIIQFMTSFMRKLDEASKRTQSAHLGWVHQKGAGRIPVGFAYGGRIIMAGGREISSGTTASALTKPYTPEGDPKFWMPCLKIITDQHHPALELIVAASFGAPLLFFTGQCAGVWGVYSAGSAGHKSTSVNVGAAVWGKPKLSRESPTSSQKGVIRKFGALRHLPIFWDEVNNPEKLEAVFQMLGSLTEGSDGTKLKRNRDAYDQDDWETMMLVASNTSLAEFVIQRSKGTDASIQRIFEVLVEKRGDTAPGHEVHSMISELEFNYGHMGLEYQKVLGNDPACLDTMVKATQARFCEEINDTSVARFRSSLAAATFAGAQLANQHLGCSFNLDELWTFMKEQYFRQREMIMEANMIGGEASSAVSTLTQFIKAHTRHIVTLGAMPTKGAKALTFISGPTLSRPDAIHIRFSAAESIMQFSKSKFDAWCVLNNQPAAMVINGLKDHLHARIDKNINLSHLAAVHGGPEVVVTVPVVAGTELAHTMYATVPVDQRPSGYEAPAGSAAAPVTAPVTNLLGAAVAQAAADLNLVKDA